MSTRLLIGDCRGILPTLPAQSVHCVVTSPPYWGLRDYGTATWEGGDPACDHVQRLAVDCHRSSTLGPKRDGLKPDNAAFKALQRQFDIECGHCGASRIDAQLGLEPDFNAYVASMVAVFREVRRVLRDDGTLWLNLGDSYFGTGKGPTPPTGIHGANGIPYPIKGVYSDPILKQKDLCGIPWRVAFALQADGWYLRQDIIWSKPNPMPESVTDRCTKAHEYMFLLSKRERYYYDAEAIAEPAIFAGKIVTLGDKSLSIGQSNGANRPKSGNALVDSVMVASTRNKRSVWEVTTQPFSEAHFATFPPALIEPCIKAGTSEKGCCAQCGKPWRREVERAQVGDWRTTSRDMDLHHGAKGGPSGEMPGYHRPIMLGWSASCACNAEIAPCTVLDPFAGAGTTGLVADRLGRNAILIELNPQYAEMSERRITDDAPLFAEVSMSAPAGAR